MGASGFGHRVACSAQAGIRRLLLALLCGGAFVACSDAPVAPAGLPGADIALDDTGSATYRSGKADEPWIGDYTDMPADGPSWEEVLLCATSFTDGAVEAAERFAIGLWHLPGIIGDFVVRLGAELIRREADLIMSLTDEQALERVRATAEADKRRLLELLTTVRRAIPEFWISLNEDTAWFSALPVEQKIELVCEVTGRLTFEVLIIIAGDKGLEKLSGLTRLQLVSGVQSKAMQFLNAARLARAAKRAVVDVGARIAGGRIQAMDPSQVVSQPLGRLEDYLERSRDELRVWALPSLAAFDEGTNELAIFVDGLQWETAAGDEWVELLLPADDALPPGAVVLDQDVDYETASAIMRALNNEVAEWGDGVFDVLREGDRYVRCLVPASTPVSQVASEVFEELEDAIADLSGAVREDIRLALWSMPEFLQLRPDGRVRYLRGLTNEFLAEN